MPIAELADGDDETYKTFVFDGESHTFGNALRNVISSYPEVVFCGYTVPHPSENKINVRIQSYEIKPVDILKRGLTDLELQCGYMLKTFNTAKEKHKNPTN